MNCNKYDCILCSLNSSCTTNKEGYKREICLHCIARLIEKCHEQIFIKSITYESFFTKELCFLCNQHMHYGHRVFLCEDHKNDFVIDSEYDLKEVFILLNNDSILAVFQNKDDAYEKIRKINNSKREDENTDSFEIVKAPIKI